MAKPILIRPKNDLWRQLREVAKAEKRKTGPMVLILLERYFASQPPAKEIKQEVGA